MLWYSGWVTMPAQDSNMPQSPDIFKDASRESSFFKSTLVPAAVILVIILAGAGTGWFISEKGGIEGLSEEVSVAPGASVSGGGKEVGLEDTATFRDKAEGILKEGGIDGEGTHHLVRDGGPSQNAYLTSSVIDLDQFVGKKVEVWGETNKAQKAGWLMDVGKIKVLE